MDSIRGKLLSYKALELHFRVGCCAPALLQSWYRGAEPSKTTKLEQRVIPRSEKLGLQELVDVRICSNEKPLKLLLMNTFATNPIDHIGQERCPNSRRHVVPLKVIGTVFFYVERNPVANQCNRNRKCLLASCVFVGLQEWENRIEGIQLKTPISVTMRVRRPGNRGLDGKRSQVSNSKPNFA
jgi:hypothetical protein